MRLPKNGDKIDIEQTKQMVDEFLDAGFTYFDTAWVYGGSEDAIRQALTQRYPRESYQLATKNAAWLKCKTREDAIAQFDDSLKKTGAGYFDFYLLHNLGEDRTHFFDDFDLWSWAQEKKAAGLIKHVGFSFHSTADELDDILNRHPETEFVQLQINYADWDSPSIQSRACYEVARKHGKPVIVMEPVKGGKLASLSESVDGIFRAAAPGASASSWAIRFAASLDGVITVLSGMSNLEQMRDNLSYMKNFRKLSDSEQETVRMAQEALKKIPVIPCTSCDYCAKVCPCNIGISGSFAAENSLMLYGNKDAALGQESHLVGAQGKNSADECSKCGECEKVCPQHIGIRDELEKVARDLLSK